MRPRVFIGSSTESLEIAFSVQRNLDHNADLEVWTQGIFTQMRYPLENLLARLEQSDFAVFVFTPNDKSWIRGAEHQVVRDNLLLEMGLFMGRLGRERCFILTPRDAVLHLPSDLSGITTLTYKPEQATTNPDAALGVACSDIRRTIAKWRVAPPARVATVFAHVKESPQFSTFLDTAQSEVLAVGPSLLYIAFNSHDHVFERARAGVSCRLLVTAASDSEAAFELIREYAAADEFQTELEVVHNRFRHWLKEAAEENLDIQVRVAPLVPIAMNFADGGEERGQLLLVPLPYRTPGADRPCFLIEKQASPAAFRLYYNKTVNLWDRSRPLT